MTVMKERNVVSDDNYIVAITKIKPRVIYLRQWAFDLYSDQDAVWWMMLYPNLITDTSEAYLTLRDVVIMKHTPKSLDEMKMMFGGIDDSN